MGCACRVMPLRIFVQGLSQVHKFETTPFLRPRAVPAALAASSAVARQSRSFHMSRFLNQDAQKGASGPLEATSESSSNIQPASETPSLTQDRQETAEPATKSEPAQAASPLSANESTDIDQPIPSRPKSTPRNLNFRGKRSFGDKPRFNRDDTFKDKLKKPRTYNEDNGDEIPWKTRHDGPRRSRPIKKDTFSSEPEVGPAPGEHAEGIPHWKTQKKALKEKFPEGWSPRKRLSPDALAGIRALNAQFPDVYTTTTLAKKFEVSPESIRRILKSKWTPNVDEEKERQDRWFKRGMQVWDRQAALGMKPPRKWRLEGIARDPSYHVQRQEAIQRNRQREEQDDREIRANMQRPGQGTKPRSS